MPTILRRILHRPAAEPRQRLTPLTPEQRERIRARILGDLPPERDVVAEAERIMGLRT